MPEQLFQSKFFFSDLHTSLLNMWKERTLARSAMALFIYLLFRDPKCLLPVGLYHVISLMNLNTITYELGVFTYFDNSRCYF